MSDAVQNGDGIVLRSADRTLTAAQLDNEACRVATLLKDAGIGKGDCVAILMRNDFHFFTLPLAVRYLGAAITPINWHLSTLEIEYILKDCGAKALFIHADLYSQALRDAAAGTTVFVSSTPQEIATAYKVGDDNLHPQEGDSSLEEMLAQAVPIEGDMGLPAPTLFYTSGTTGKPKAVERRPIPPEAVQALMARTAFAFGLDSDAPRAVMTGPLYHSAPNAYGLNVLRKGGYLAIQARYDSEELLQIIERDKITNLHMVPTMFQRMLVLPAALRSKYDFSSLRHVAHGSAPCPSDVKRRMIEWFGECIHEYYAMTEAGIIACSSSRQWLDNPGTVGTPPKGVDIEIRHDDGTVCSVNEAGNICIRHEATHAFAYKGADHKIQEMRQGDFIITGDVGYLNQDGFLYISDRKTDMILSGGVNIYPAEIEAAIAENRAVKDSAAFGVPDPNFGEKVVAYIETTSVIEEAALREFLQERIAKFKIPRVFKFVEHLPREDSGKVKKRYLRDEYLSENGGNT